jgi:hypothetical protein
MTESLEQLMAENNRLIKKLYSASENVTSVRAREYSPSDKVKKQYALMQFMTGGRVIDDVKPERNPAIFHGASEKNKPRPKTWQFDLMRMITGQR